MSRSPFHSAHFAGLLSPMPHRGARKNKDLRSRCVLQKVKIMSSHISPHHNTRLPALAPADSRGGGGAANNPGNFANDPARAAEAGQKGGQHSHASTTPTPEKTKAATHAKGSHTSGNFADDPKRAAEAGRKGGEHSHGGK